MRRFYGCAVRTGNLIRCFFLTFRASLHQGAGRFDEAIRLCLEAERLVPGDDLAMTGLIAAYQCSGRWEEARVLIARQLSRDPDDAVNNQDMVETLLHMGAPEREITPFLQAFVRGRSKRPPSWAPTSFFGKLVIQFLDFILWPIKRVKFSKFLEREMESIKKKSDEWYDWAIRSLRNR